MTHIILNIPRAGLCLGLFHSFFLPVMRKAVGEQRFSLAGGFRHAKLKMGKAVPVTVSIPVIFKIQ